MGLDFFELILTAINISLIFSLFQYLIHNEILRPKKEIAIFFVVIFFALTLYNAFIIVTDNFLPRLIFNFVLLIGCNKFIFNNKWIQSALNALLLFTAAMVAEMITIAVFMIFSISIADTQNDIVLNLILNQGILIVGTFILLFIRKIIKKNFNKAYNRVIIGNLIMVSGGVLIGGGLLGRYLYRLPMTLSGLLFALFLTVVIAAYLGLLITLIVLFNKNELNKASLFKVEEETKFDVLTKAYTRQYGLRKLRDLAHAIYNNKESLSICFIDVNNLKQVNDTYGHLEGDSMLNKICNTIQNNLRADDFIIRYGGDEFLIVFQDLGDYEIRAIMNRVLDELKSMEFGYDVTFAYGVKVVEDMKNKSIDDYIELADSNMYEHKKIMKA